MSRLSVQRLVSGSARRPWAVVGAWVLALIASVAVVATLLGGALTSDDDFTGNPESKRGDAILAEAFPRGTGFDADAAVVVRSPTETVDSAAFARRVESLSTGLRALGGGRLVAGVKDYYDERDRALVSPDRRTTVLLVDVRGDIEPVMELLAAEDGRQGFETVLTGEDPVDVEIETQAEEDLQRGEMLGLGVALLILLVVFGALGAALVPIAVALVAIVGALALTALVGQAFELSFFVVSMLVMMGLAVGIDYSLFVVSRFREERSQGRDTLDAIARGGARASRAVFFSGVTVVIALLGMLLVPQTIFRSLATGAILVVLVSVVAALTLLPALLALLGDGVDALRLPFVRRSGAAGAPLSGRVVGLVIRRPAVSLAASAGVVVALALPIAGFTSGTAGVSTLPDGFQTKRAFTILERSFGPQESSSAHVVVNADPTTPAAEAAIGRLRSQLASDSRFGEPEVEVSRTAEVGRVDVPVAGDPLGEEAASAVRDLREDYIPRAFEGTGIEVLVAGDTAGEIDLYDLVDRYQPIVFAFVLGLSFVLLVLAFRSLVVAGLAVVLNLLSVGAAFGLLVLVFQHGVGANLLGFSQVDTIQAWLPLFLFTVLFGLSMDYHVFLLSRIRERYERSGDTRDAVASGVQSTARIITGAALIMVAVFGGFATGELVMFQQMGFGLGAAVLLDATLVRLVLVPAAMTLLGRWNWYLPHTLRRLPVLRSEPAAE